MVPLDPPPSPHLLLPLPYIIWRRQGSCFPPDLKLPPLQDLRPCPLL
ncbi:hypothetical protein E2C01_067668 [Portunus trituberculatus]|uniref:Uncharacterized protein n=1 Tax=Portunus trituberculatus TaxID=210409 RepID=A0A5B7HY19_PORTR|nr:hypothetical protein [Portunus trituberculatus]